MHRLIGRLTITVIKFKIINFNFRIKSLRGFLISKIINEGLYQKLEELLKTKDLNGRKWSLIYKGSRDGFRASDFHSHCDNYSNTLTIVKSTREKIFGGYTTNQWSLTGNEPWQIDNSAFIFSLVNKENRPLIFEQTCNDGHSIGSFKHYGPIFGAGNDIFISDSSNTNIQSFSNLGATYTHPDYPYGSEKAKTILAGARYFQVQEIEVFHMQQ